MFPIIRKINHCSPLRHCVFYNRRALSKLQNRVSPQLKQEPLVSKEEVREFVSLFPQVVRDLKDEIEIPDLLEKYDELLQYNVPTGKKNRGLTVIGAYKMLETPENLTMENIRLANLMGWCVEMLGAFFLIVDDIVDGSETRHGAPCWYKRPDVGLNAANDQTILENSIYILLKKYFSQHHCYLPAMEHFHDIIFKSCMGEALDLQLTVDGKVNWELFTVANFQAMSKYKTTYYSFHLPVGLAMYLANIYDVELHRQAGEVFVDMGLFYQVQNDFYDCFGDVGLTGRSGSDIQGGKCTWLAVSALERASSSQRRVMEENYGKPCVEAEETVKNLYKELELPQLYSAYEKEILGVMSDRIRRIDSRLPQDLFVKISERFFANSYWASSEAPRGKI